VNSRMRSRPRSFGTSRTRARPLGWRRLRLNIAVASPIEVPSPFVTAALSSFRCFKCGHFRGGWKESLKKAKRRRHAAEISGKRHTGNQSFGARGRQTGPTRVVPLFSGAQDGGALAKAAATTSSSVLAALARVPACLRARTRHARRRMGASQPISSALVQGVDGEI
jgi:hypothetical protein